MSAEQMGISRLRAELVRVKMARAQMARDILGTTSRKTPFVLMNNR